MPGEVAASRTGRRFAICNLHLRNANYGAFMGAADMLKAVRVSHGGIAIISPLIPAVEFNQTASNAFVSQVLSAGPQWLPADPLIQIFLA